VIEAVAIENALIDEAIGRTNLQDRMTCREGCFTCCKEAVYTTEDAVRHAWDSLPPSEKIAIIPRLAEWVERVNPVIKIKEPHVLQYRSKNAWCPFLKDGKCTVYSARPGACRTHIAVGPKAHCENDNLRPHQTFASIPGVDLMLAQHRLGRDGFIEIDHLGVHLYNLLSKHESETKGEPFEKFRSGTYVKVSFADAPTIPVLRESIKDDE